jgi:hypothetical protein
MRVKLVGLLAVLAAMLASSTTAWGAALPAPSSFTISAPGTVSQGVTIKPVMKKRRDIGLVVFKEPKHTEVGTVVLGTFSAGRPSIHWNLKVHAKLLGSGSYLISLRVFANGKPTTTPAPRPRKLTITGQHVRAG